MPVKPPSETSFGRTFFVVFALLAGLMLWRQHFWSAGFAAAASVFFVGAAYLRPEILKPVNLLWFRFGLLLHRIVNPVVMGLLFFAVFTPMGAIMRTAGKDFLRLRRKSGTESLWIERTAENAPETSMKTQF